MTPDPLDDFVRTHLDREAARVNPADTLRRVRERPRAEPHRRGRWVSVVVGATVAACVAGVFLFGGNPPQAAAATPEQLVRAARAVHTAPTDRCYDVSAEWEPGLFRRLALPPIVRKSKLWTRGDQFWIESGLDGQLSAWGQESDGRVWVALGRKRGLTYDPSEVGEPIARYAELMSLRLLSTLAEVLEKYDLAREDAGTPGEPIRIKAVIRPTMVNPKAKFREVRLTLDPETKVIREAVLERQLNGDPAATLKFTLIDTSPQPDGAYELRGHLDPGADVLDGKQSPRRTRFRDEFLKRMQERLKERRRTRWVRR